MTYIYICNASYMHIWHNILLRTAHTAYIYIYIYIYAAQDPKYHMQDTDAAGSTSQHSITI